MNKILTGIRFVVRDLISDGWRSIMTIIILTIFISCYFCLASLAEAGKKFGSQKVDSCKLIMIAHNVFDLSDSLITDTDFNAARELSPSLIKSISPLILKHLNVEGYLLQVRGASIEDFQSIHSLSLLQGTWPTGEREVVIGEGTVSLTNWKVGDEVCIFGVDHTITGIVRAGGTKFGSIWMRMENAEQLFDTRGVYQFGWIVLQKDVDAQSVIDLLQNDPRVAGQFDVYYADQMYELYTNGLREVKENSSMLAILSLICVMLGVYGSIYLTMYEKSRELTIIRSIGFNSQEIRWILSLRTSLQVIAAFFLGLGISFLAVKVYEKYYPIMVYSIPLPVIVSSNTLIIGIFCVLVFAWLGVWLPTRHLKKRTVISMLKR